MRLHETNVSVGNWLFRYRSYIPLLMLFVLIPATLNRTYPFGIHSYDLIYEMFCFGISMFGLGIRAYTIGHTPIGTSGRNTKRQLADSLNIDGIYSTTRNPLYLGNFFMMLGVVMFTYDFATVLIFVLFFWLYYEKIIQAEESFLSQKYKEAYEEYCKNTRTFIPSFKNYRVSKLEFSFKNVLKREYNGFFGVIFSFVVLELISNYVVQNRIFIDTLWSYIFIIGLILFITLRTLKKNTKLLHAEGR